MPPQALAAGPVDGGGLGQAAGHAQAAEQARPDIGEPGSDELLIGLQSIAVSGCEQPPGAQSLGKAHETDGGTGQQHVNQLARRHDRDRRGGSPLGTAPTTATP